MSLLKLESLPNEILLYFLENHTNAVDIFMGFAGQTNRRIDGLIAQCREFRFDFFRCKQDDFHLCLKILPSLTDRISELYLSEWNAPGQVYIFLSLFPSFRSFKNLRTLYLHTDMAYQVRDKVIEALYSLKYLKNLNKLSIHTGTSCDILTLSTIFHLLRLPTLKRLSIVGPTGPFEYSSFENLELFSSNIEHLTITGVRCQWIDIRMIARCAPHLRYLNVRLINENSYSSERTGSTMMPILLNLHTLIIHFEQDDSTTFEMVAQFLQNTPNLRRLELTAHDALVKATPWERLIQNTLPNLTQFYLKTSPSRLKKRIIEEVLLSFQTSFWIEKHTFYLLILEDKHLLNNRNTMNHIRGRSRQNSNYGNTEFRTTSIYSTNTITGLYFFGNSSLLSCNHSFNNIRYIVIAYPEKNLVQWITKHVNCSSIEEVDISLCRLDQTTVIPLLTLVRNIKSLKLDTSQLIMYEMLYLGTNYYLKSLALSDVNNIFNENMIETISRLFPLIEHVEIDVSDLSCIPILRKYFPHLQSLTFKSTDSFFYLISRFQREIKNNELASKFESLFHRDGDWTTIWLNSTVFKSEFWKTFRKQSARFNEWPETTYESRYKRLKF